MIAYNLGNLWRRLVLPQRIGNWSRTSLQPRLVKTGGQLVKHVRYYWLLLAESHLTRRLFGAMVGRIDAASVGITQAVAAPKKTVPISPRKGEVSEKAGPGSRSNGFSGPGEGRLGAGGTPLGERLCPEGLTGSKRMYTCNRWRTKKLIPVNVANLRSAREAKLNRRGQADHAKDLGL